MKKTYLTKDMQTLPGTETALCGCGCGAYFMRTKQARPAQYVNATHKKRAARARAKETRTETTVRITPKGWLYLKTHETEALEVLWGAFTKEERCLIEMLCRTGMEPRQVAQALESAFGIY